MGVSDSTEDMALAMARGFDRASAAGPASRDDLAMAGRTVRLGVAGPGLAARLAPAFAHLRLPSGGGGGADLAVGLWDEAATGVPRPISDLRAAFADTRPYGDGLVASARGGRLLGHQTPRACAILDLDAGAAHGWVREAAALSLFEAAKPLLPLLFAWLDAADLVPVHAGLVAREGRGVLLGGAGGSGKSTTALLCARAGLDYLGDDYVAVGAPGPAGGAVAHSLYANAWLHPAHGGRLPWLAGHRLADEAEVATGKAAFALADALAGRLARRATIAAIALPRVAPGASATRVGPAAPAEALRRLSPSAVLQLPFVRPARTMARLAALVRSVPSYWLDLGGDLDGVAPEVDSILEGAAA